MSNNNFHTGTEIKQLFKDFKEYLEIKYDLLKLEASEKLVTLLSSFYSFFILLVLIPFALFFFSIGGAFYLSDMLGSYVYGFAVVGVVYCFLIILFMLLRNILISRPLVRFMIDLFFPNKKT